MMVAVEDDGSSGNRERTIREVKPRRRVGKAII